MESEPYLLLAVQWYMPAWCRSATRCSCEVMPPRPPLAVDVGVSMMRFVVGSPPPGVDHAIVTGGSPDAAQSSTTAWPAAPLTFTERVWKCAGTVGRAGEK